MLSPPHNLSDVIIMVATHSMNKGKPHCSHSSTTCAGQPSGMVKRAINGKCCPFSGPTLNVHMKSNDDSIAKSCPKCQLSSPLQKYKLTDIKKDLLSIQE